jgi:hypothetical protein
MNDTEIFIEKPCRNRGLGFCRLDNDQYTLFLVFIFIRFRAWAHIVPESNLDNILILLCISSVNLQTAQDQTISEQGTKKKRA